MWQQILKKVLQPLSQLGECTYIQTYKNYSEHAVPAWCPCMNKPGTKLGHDNNMCGF